MSRVHCLECGGAVVVDPRGVCPEGHHVGTGGDRVEAAMGHRTVHPDEPEPWVYRIDPDEVTGARTGSGASSDTGQPPAVPREARPLAMPGGPGDEEVEERDGTESLLRELHSLAALEASGGGQDRQPEPPPVPTAPTAATAPPPPPPVAGPRADPDTIADVFAELSALDATPPTPPPSALGRTGTASTEQAPTSGPDQLSALFGAAPQVPEAGTDPAGTQRPALTVVRSEVVDHFDLPASAGADAPTAVAVPQAPEDVEPEPDWSGLLDGLEGDTPVEEPSATQAAEPQAVFDAAAEQAPTPVLAASPPVPGPGLTSFTAKGGSGARGKRRLFSR